MILRDNVFVKVVLGAINYKFLHFNGFSQMKFISCFWFYVGVQEPASHIMIQRYRLLLLENQTSPRASDYYSPASSQRGKESGENTPVSCT